MTELQTIGDEKSPEGFLLVTERHFDRSVEALNTVIEDIKSGNVERSKDVAGALSLLNKALQSALDERAKVEKLRRQDAGVVHDYALDFDAARDEIGRRLARLRAAGSGGGVPGGAE